MGLCQGTEELHLVTEHSVGSKSLHKAWDPGAGIASTIRGDLCCIIEVLPAKIHEHGRLEKTNSRTRAEHEVVRTACQIRQEGGGCVADEDLSERKIMKIAESHFCACQTI